MVWFFLEMGLHFLMDLASGSSVPGDAFFVAPTASGLSESWREKFLGSFVVGYVAISEVCMLMTVRVLSSRLLKVHYVLCASNWKNVFLTLDALLHHLLKGRESRHPCLKFYVSRRELMCFRIMVVS